jgi:integrase
MRTSFLHNGIKYYVYGKTKKELNERVKKKKSEICIDYTKFSFSEWSNEFLDVYKSDVCEDTVRNYKMRIDKHIIPYIGNLKINKITHLQCQKVLNNLKGYSNNYIRKIYYDMHQIFQKAVFNGIIENNPVDRCEVPKGYSNTHRAITDEERTAILNLAKTHPSGLYILIMLYCGLRPHEVSIIQGKDIKDNVLHIRGTKTYFSDRYVPIPNALFPYIPELDDSEYLLKSVTGIAPTKKCHRTKLWNTFKKDLAKLIDVADDLTPYCFRHTYCTDLQDAGVPINVAKDLMGHSTIRLTADIYSHKTTASFNDSTAKINAYFSGA